MQPVDRTTALLRILKSDHPGLSQQEILEEFRRAILSGNVPAGSLIPVDETAKLFGVSRIPIRETLKTLIGEGLVEHQPRAGYTVASLTVDELREIYVVRAVLELAALTAAVGNATADDDRRAAQALRALDRAMATKDYTAYQRESRQFHLALISPARMPRLLHMIELVWNITEPIQPMTRISNADRDYLHAEHSNMLRAFTGRDATELLIASRRHLNDLEAVVADLPSETGWSAE